MTSKEALDKLETIVIEANNFNEVCNDEFNSCVDAVNIIKKDLEVLDILKKNIVCKDGTTTTFDTRDEKVKEWLEKC